MFLAEFTGRGVTIAVVDSGVHASHPHVGGVDGGFGIRDDGAMVDDRRVLVAAPYPRDIPGVPRDKNVHGISFAVANASAFVARALEAAPGADIAQVFATLEAAGCGPRSTVV